MRTCLVTLAVLLLLLLVAAWLAAGGLSTVVALPPVAKIGLGFGALFLVMLINASRG